MNVFPQTNFLGWVSVALYPEQGTNEKPLVLKMLGPKMVANPVDSCVVLASKLRSRATHVPKKPPCFPSYFFSPRPRSSHEFHFRGRKRGLGTIPSG